MLLHLAHTPICSVIHRLTHWLMTGATYPNISTDLTGHLAKSEQGHFLPGVAFPLVSGLRRGRRRTVCNPPPRCGSQSSLHLIIVPPWAPSPALQSWEGVARQEGPTLRAVTRSSAAAAASFTEAGAGAPRLSRMERELFLTGCICTVDRWALIAPASLPSPDFCLLPILAPALRAPGSAPRLSPFCPLTAQLLHTALPSFSSDASLSVPIFLCWPLGFFLVLASSTQPF